MAIEDNGTMTATAKKRCDEKEQDEDLAWESDPFYNTVREYVAKLLQDKRMSTGSCKGWLRAKHVGTNRRGLESIFEMLEPIAGD
eukprot:918028-Prorocentrum_minimum.AAC.3